MRWLETRGLFRKVVEQHKCRPKRERTSSGQYRAVLGCNSNWSLGPLAVSIARSSVSATGLFKVPYGPLTRMWTCSNTHSDSFLISRVTRDFLSSCAGPLIILGVSLALGPRISHQFPQRSETAIRKSSTLIIEALSRPRY